MRFISAKGAPDLPLEVLNAQENDRLIFFCGAGISYPAGLPGFGKLVEETYERLGDDPNSLETEAIDKKEPLLIQRNDIIRVTDFNPHFAA